MYQQPAAYVHVVPYGVEIPNRVFIGGLSHETSEEDLYQFFTQFGQVKDTKIVLDKDNGTPKGYGFVTFENSDDAFKVYSRGSIFYKKKKLNVAKAVRKQGGQYHRANQEYLNGQRAVYYHPNGYLVSQYDGAWHFEDASPHSQPVKPCYAVMPGNVYSPQATQAQYHIPNSLNGGSPLSHTEGGAPYYQTLPHPSPTYTYLTEPISSPSVLTAPTPPHHKGRSRGTEERGRLSRRRPVEKTLVSMAARNRVERPKRRRRRREEMNWVISRKRRFNYL